MFQHTHEISIPPDSAGLKRSDTDCRATQAARILVSPAIVSLTRAAAVSLYKLMAYKDEYEVARLYTDGRFAKYRAETWTGGTARVWLAPPLLAKKGPDGTLKRGCTTRAALPLIRNTRLKARLWANFQALRTIMTLRVLRRHANPQVRNMHCLEPLGCGRWPRWQAYGWRSVIR